MEMLLYISAALSAYLVAGWNPAITFSRAIYKKDIRTCGSKNPGFTNFKRTFGNKWAWWVLALDLSKAAIVALIFAVLFENYLDCYQFGAAYTGIFAMLGHAYPVWYKFKGGKGFLVCLSTAWVTDPRVGLIATVIMIVLLLSTKYMSLST
ncbi:MAG: glycerol-3-phosphate acyltransferase, partial [Clostridia bacterium]|nr:glycerol-3-phosphate acyltransferase [Clostridia bacterium]